MSRSQAQLGAFAAQDPLTDAERAAYEAVEQGNRTAAAFARATGRTPSTVRTLLWRARAKLRA
jgi:DNA-binding CsgD family transcriptional regulator